jgi:L-lactate dehydrogenase complex protein LldG
VKGRNDILAAIRANKPALKAPAPEVPSFDEAYPTDTTGLWPRFADALALMGGSVAEIQEGQSLEDCIRATLADRLPEQPIIASAVPELTGNRRLREHDNPKTLHDIDIAVLRARFGVAETGSVCFTEKELIVNAVAYLAQHLVVLLDPAELVTNIHRAYQRDDYKNARYTVFHTGPSATADIEGVLVRGAQGVRSLTVIAASVDTPG